MKEQLAEAYRVLKEADKTEDLEIKAMLKSIAQKLIEGVETRARR